MEEDNKKKRVLLVDDDKGFCLFVKKKLNNTENFEVLVANNGFWGIELARTKTPDIILLDLVLPDIPGDEVAIELNMLPETSAIPKVFLTALASREYTDNNVLKKTGDSYLIAKPVRTNELIMGINYVLGSI